MNSYRKSNSLKIYANKKTFSFLFHKRLGLLVLAISFLMAGCGPKFELSEAAYRKQTSTGVKVRPEVGIPKTPSVEYIRIRMTDSVFLDPPEVDNPSIYVRVRNTSGRDIDLQAAVAQKLRSLGYKITRNASTATYVLQANLLFADEVSVAELAKIDETKYGFSIGRTAAGLLVGAGLGAGAGALLGDGDVTGEAIVGGVVGGAVGAIGDALSQRSRNQRMAAKQWIRYFSLVVDIQLRERIKGEKNQVFIEGSSGSSAQGDDQAGSREQGFASGQDSQSSYSRRESQTYSETSDWKRYQTRILGKAKGKLVVFEDVQQDFAVKVASSIAGLF